MKNKSMSDVTVLLYIGIIIVHGTINQWIIYNMISLTLSELNEMLMSDAPIVIRLSSKVDMMQNSYHNQIE